MVDGPFSWLFSPSPMGNSSSFGSLGGGYTPPTPAGFQVPQGLFGMPGRGMPTALPGAPGMTAPANAPPMPTPGPPMPLAPPGAGAAAGGAPPSPGLWQGPGQQGQQGNPMLQQFVQSLLSPPKLTPAPWMQLGRPG